MSETPDPHSDAAAAADSADDLREHAQDPAEGADEETEQRPDVPRVHPEEPAEG